MYQVLTGVSGYQAYLDTRSVARHVDAKICISPCALLSRGFQTILMCSRGYLDDLNGPVLCFQVILTCIWPSIGLLYNFQFSAARARRRVAPKLGSETLKKMVFL